MSIQDLGSLGELIAAIATVATLVYLSMQLRNNSKQLKLNTTQSFAALLQDSYGPIYNNSDTMRIWTIGKENPESLSSSEQDIFILFMDRLFNNIVTLVAHYEAGVMPLEEFEHYRGMYRGLVDTPGGQFYRKSPYFDHLWGTLNDA